MGVSQSSHALTAMEALAELRLHGEVSSLNNMVRHKQHAELSKFCSTVVEKWELLASPAITAHRYAGPRELLASVLDASNSKNQTALWTACAEGEAEAVALLLEHGANPWIADIGGRTPLHAACIRGKASCVTALLDNVPEHYATMDGVRLEDARSVSGFSPITYAVAYSHVECLEALLIHEPSLLVSNRSVGYEHPMGTCPGLSTPLHVAALLSTFDVALILLRHFAERRSSMPDLRMLRDLEGNQPWQVARERGIPDLAHVLHPQLPLQHLFPPETFSCKGIRTLTSIAAAALRTHLLHSINAAAVEAAAAEGAAEAAAAGPRPGRRGGAGVARAPPMRRSLEGGCAESAARQQRRLFRLQQYQAAQHARDSASLDGTSDLGSLRGGSDDGDVASSRSCAASPLPHRWPGLRGGAKGEGGEAPGALAVLGEDAGAEAEGGNNKGACEGPCTCGICMDHACALRIRGCRHGLCDECARHLLQCMGTTPLLCPFCREPIPGFECRPLQRGGVVAGA